MTDICKCNGNGCELRLQCFRFLAEDGLRQSYADYDTNREDPAVCDGFWEIRNNDELEMMQEIFDY
jgi:hypothetical protein